MEIRVDSAFRLKFKKTRDDYLEGWGVVCLFNNIQTYYNNDGTKRLEFRPKDEVLKPDTLESMKTLPVTLDHPNQFLNSKNINDKIVGYTGESIHIDENKVALKIIITHEDAIKAIMAGKRQLSLGYSLNLTEEKGKFNNDEYTHIQKNIICNHLSIVAKARAGSDATIHTDSQDQLMHFDELEFEIENEEIGKKMENIDSTDSEVKTEEKIEEKTEISEVKAPEEISTISEKENSDENTDSIDSVLGRLTDLVDKLVSVKSMHKNSDSSEYIQKLVKQRCKVLEDAKKVVNVDHLFDKSNREIMEFVLKSKDKTFD